MPANGTADRPKVEREGFDEVESTEARVNRALDKVRPLIQSDGGEVWLVKIEAETAYVQMLGACGGCPASTMTLKGAIEAVVTSDVPEITSVEQI
jgi:Fe-S cluster biogenesis protein NfuA